MSKVAPEQEKICFGLDIFSIAILKSASIVMMLDNYLWSGCFSGRSALFEIH